MATLSNPTAPSKPRPFLEIVKAMQLDRIAVPKDNKTKRATKSGPPRLTMAANDSTILESGRNNALISMAGVMRRKGMTEVAIAAALQAENQGRCTPPLDDAEVAAIAASIMRYEESDSGDLLKSLTDAGNAADSLGASRAASFSCPVRAG